MKKFLAGVGERVVVTVVASIVLAILTAVALWFLGVLQWAWHGLGATVEIYRWHYWLLPILGFVGGLAAAFGLLIFTARGPTAEEHTAYTTDTFFGMRWRWRWDDYEGLLMESLTAYCLTCDRVLHYHHGYEGPGFLCQHCEVPIEGVGTLDVVRRRVATEIDLALRSGKWKDKVQAA